jgi:hypothetical protein
LRATCSSCQQLTVASIGPESSAFDLLRAFVTGSDSSVAEQLQVPFHCFFLLHILNQLFSRVIFANQRLIIRFPSTQLGALPPSLPSPLWPNLTFRTLKRFYFPLRFLAVPLELLCFVEFIS